MPARPPRVYIDANILIAYLADEAGRADVVQAAFHTDPPSSVVVTAPILEDPSPTPADTHNPYCTLKREEPTI